MPELETANGEIATSGAPALSDASPASGTPESDGSDAPPRQAPDGPGPIPWADHDRIVNGFHERLDSLSWARAYDPETVRRAVTYFEAAQRHAQTRSLEQARPEPGPDARDDRGEMYYSPKRAAQWAAWMADQIVTERLAALEERLGPLETTIDRSNKLGSVSRQIDAAEQWPAFGDHVDEITNTIAQARQQGYKMTLAEAYIHVVAPKLAAAEQTSVSKAKQQLMDDMNDTNARAKDDVNPRRAASSQKVDFRRMPTKDVVRAVREDLEKKAREGKRG